MSQYALSAVHARTEQDGNQCCAEGQHDHNTIYTDGDWLCYSVGVVQCQYKCCTDVFDTTRLRRADTARRQSEQKRLRRKKCCMRVTEDGLVLPTGKAGLGHLHVFAK